MLKMKAILNVSWQCDTRYPAARACREQENDAGKDATTSIAKRRLDPAAAELRKGPEDEIPG